jgi:hypothetical protein
MVETLISSEGETGFLQPRNKIAMDTIRKVFMILFLLCVVLLTVPQNVLEMYVLIFCSPPVRHNYD